MAPITMDELLAKLLDSAADTNSRINDLGTKLEARLHEVVTEAVDPIKERLVTLETGMAGLRNDVSRDIMDLREKLSNLDKNTGDVPVQHTASNLLEAQAGEAATSWAAVSAKNTPTKKQVTSPEGNSNRQRRMFLEIARRRKIGLDKEMMDIMEKAQRTIAFFPIQAEEVRAIELEMKQSGEWEETDIKDEAIRKAIIEFQTGEMKMSETDCEAQNIVEVFTPKYADYRTVYAVFETAEEADNVLSMCLYLRQSNRVSNHVPWRARERQSALEGRAKTYRDKGYRTRITIKDLDYSLVIKHRENPGGWRLASDVEDLPPFLSAQSQRATDKSLSPSQAKGRTLRVGLRKHPRSPHSDKQGIPVNKRLRQSTSSVPEQVTITDCEDEEDIEEFPRTTIQVDAPSIESNVDQGNFISIQYASPAKTILLANQRGKLTRECRNLQ